MKNILAKQQSYLCRLSNQTRNPIDSINTAVAYRALSVHDVCEYVKSQSFFMDEEVTELITAFGKGDRAVFKPWSARHQDLVCRTYVPDDRTKSEAIDMLRFCLNICLAAGITPDNIDEEFDKVLNVSLERLDNGY